MAELHPDNACNAARTALGYAQAFDGKGIDWQSDEPWPHRIELAQALDWIAELGAMVLNLADRVPAVAQCGCRTKPQMHAGRVAPTAAPV